eukprot:5443239-Pyramimonas_sp.AAC.1
MGESSKGGLGRARLNLSCAPRAKLGASGTPPSATQLPRGGLDVILFPGDAIAAESEATGRSRTRL